MSTPPSPFDGAAREAGAPPRAAADIDAELMVAARRLSANDEAARRDGIARLEALRAAHPGTPWAARAWNLLADDARRHQPAGPRSVLLGLAAQVASLDDPGLPDLLDSLFRSGAHEPDAARARAEAIEKLKALLSRAAESGSPVPALAVETIEQTIHAHPEHKDALRPTLDRLQLAAAGRRLEEARTQIDAALRFAAGKVPADWLAAARETFATLRAAHTAIVAFAAAGGSAADALGRALAAHKDLHARLGDSDLPVVLADQARTALALLPEALARFVERQARACVDLSAAAELARLLAGLPADLTVPVRIEWLDTLWLPLRQRALEALATAKDPGAVAKAAGSLPARSDLPPVLSDAIEALRQGIRRVEHAWRGMLARGEAADAKHAPSASGFAPLTAADLPAAFVRRRDLAQELDTAVAEARAALDAPAPPDTDKLRGCEARLSPLLKDWPGHAPLAETLAGVRARLLCLDCDAALAEWRIDDLLTRLRAVAPGAGGPAARMLAPYQALAALGQPLARAAAAAHTGAFDDVATAERWWRDWQHGLKARLPDPAGLPEPLLRAMDREERSRSVQWCALLEQQSLTAAAAPGPAVALSEAAARVASLVTPARAGLAALSRLLQRRALLAQLDAAIQEQDWSPAAALLAGQPAADPEISRRQLAVQLGLLDQRPATDRARRWVERFDALADALGAQAAPRLYALLDELAEQGAAEPAGPAAAMLPSMVSAMSRQQASGGPVFATAPAPLGAQLAARVALVEAELALRADFNADTARLAAERRAAAAPDEARRLAARLLDYWRRVAEQAVSERDPARWALAWAYLAFGADQALFGTETDPLTVLSVALDSAAQGWTRQLKREIGTDKATEAQAWLDAMEARWRQLAEAAPAAPVQPLSTMAAALRPGAGQAELLRLGDTLRELARLRACVAEQGRADFRDEAAQVAFDACRERARRLADHGFEVARAAQRQLDAMRPLRDGLPGALDTLRDGAARLARPQSLVEHGLYSALREAVWNIAKWLAAAGGEQAAQAPALAAEIGAWLREAAEPDCAAAAPTLDGLIRCLEQAQQQEDDARRLIERLRAALPAEVPEDADAAEAKLADWLALLPSAAPAHGRVRLLFRHCALKEAAALLPSQPRGLPAWVAELWREGLG